MFGKTVIFRKESEDVYLALIEDLARTLLPTSIMGVTLVIVDLFAWSATGNTVFLAAAIAGGSGSAAKILLMFVQKQNCAKPKNQVKYAVRLEAMHGMATFAVAASVGSVLAAAFSLHEPNLQILSTGLLFGYCSGVVSRTAIRPKIAIIALVLAAAPAAFAASLINSPAHNILAAMFGVFLLGAIETVRHTYLSTVRHITSRIEMAKLARNDPLTGLANRLSLREAYREASLTTRCIAIHCLDLDGFKSVNDQFGHAAGDAILVNVAQRLSEVAPPNATVARFGGDEFVILQTEIFESIEAELLAKEIVNSLAKPFTVQSRIIEIGASLGLSVGSASTQLDELLQLADEASYFIKRNGGGVAIASTSHFSPVSERFRTYQSKGYNAKPEPEQEHTHRLKP
ncbi:diguanylate cyclase (GGDEF) domain-containing protein [Pseudomonas grimontii]|uniref:Diguanylate cyclase (GGDEF) domain-containing protein n=1 Tax=Pseudomonas grimontii TaxID=129847 RepID=A0A1H1ILD9_9PSED|nr:GGDEF domain-containing protein [Pseudomonas grimontii]TWR64409.1 GGDEF domain-containing protein [Pseudomonas grimontii]SDR38379.1 diguanylate cyclase (GGDEF) domain-containing protein [Pseudomonas grimontii]